MSARPLDYHSSRLIVDSVLNFYNVSYEKLSSFFPQKYWVSFAAENFDGVTYAPGIYVCILVANTIIYASNERVIFWLKDIDQNMPSDGWRIVLPFYK